MSLFAQIICDPASPTEELYDLAAQSKSLNGHKVQFIPFPSSLGYRHKFIYKSPQLPNILSDFLSAPHPHV